MNFASMKPFQIILLVVFAGLAVIGLIVFANFGPPGSGGKVGSVIIWGTVPQQRMDAVIGNLRNGNQDFNGVSYVEKPKATFDTDLAEALASGDGPDLILISQEELVTEQNKLKVISFDEISQRTYRDTFLPIDELFLAADGTYGIPLAVDPLVLYYNRSLLTSAGIATPPKSWEAVTSLTPQLTRVQGSTIGMSAIPLGAYDNVENARATLSLLLFQAGSPISAVTETGPRARLLSSSAETGSTATQSALTFYTQFADPVKTVYTWNRVLPSARQAFLAGQLAFYPGFASELPDLRVANPNLDFDITPMPQPQTSSQKVTYGLAYAFAVPKATKNEAGAVSVAKVLSGAAYAQANAQALSMAPATRASLGTSKADRFQPVYFPQALYARGWLSPSASATDRIFSTMISNITSGRLGVGEALSTANEAIDAAL